MLSSCVPGISSLLQGYSDLRMRQREVACLFGNMMFIRNCAAHLEPVIRRRAIAITTLARSVEDELLDALVVDFDRLDPIDFADDRRTEHLGRDTLADYAALLH